MQKAFSRESAERTFSAEALLLVQEGLYVQGQCKTKLHKNYPFKGIICARPVLPLIRLLAGLAEHRDKPLE